MSKNNDLKKKDTKGFIRKINRDINNSISKINGLPKIEIDNFSSEDLKTELIPMLEEAKERVRNIDEITNNLLAIRKEILDPVNKTIQKNSKLSNYFSIFGIVIGLIGIFLAVESNLDNFFTLVDQTHYSQSQSPLEKSSRTENISSHSQSIEAIPEDKKIEIFPLSTKEDSNRNQSIEATTDHITSCTIEEAVETQALNSKIVQECYDGYGGSIFNSQAILLYLLYLLISIEIIGVVLKPRFLKALVIKFIKSLDGTQGRPNTIHLRTHAFKKWFVPFYPETIYIGNILFIAKRRNNISFIIKDKNVKKIYIDNIERDKSKENILLIGSELKIETNSNFYIKYELTSIF